MFTVSVFPVQANKESEVLSFGLRAATADYIRGEYRRKIVAAVGTGISKVEAMQKFGLLWAQARHSFKNLRDIPASLLSWGAYVEFHGGETGFPVALPESVGTFNRDVLTLLPAGVAAIRLAGMNFTGLMNDDQPIRMHEVSEVRVSRTGDGQFTATVVMGHADDDSAAADTPMPTEPAEID